MMNAGVVNQEVQRQAVERPPGRPAPVHGHTQVHQNGKLVRYLLRRTKPMQTVKQRSDVVVSTGLEDELSRCIHDRLETI